jgi:hypothetical protein
MADINTAPHEARFEAPAQKGLDASLLIGGAPAARDSLPASVQNGSKEAEKFVAKTFGSLTIEGLDKSDTMAGKEPPRSGGESQKPGPIPSGADSNPHPGPLPSGGDSNPHPGPLPSGGDSNSHPGPLQSGADSNSHPGPLPSGGDSNPHPGAFPSGGDSNPHLGPLPDGIGGISKPTGQPPQSGC